MFPCLLSVCCERPQLTGADRELRVPNLPACVQSAVQPGAPVYPVHPAPTRKQVFVHNFVFYNICHYITRSQVLVSASTITIYLRQQQAALAAISNQSTATFTSRLSFSRIFRCRGFCHAGTHCPDKCKKRNKEQSKENVELFFLHAH